MSTKSQFWQGIVFVPGEASVAVTGIGSSYGPTVSASVGISTSDAAVNAKNWELIGFTNGNFQIRTQADAYGTTGVGLSMTRTGSNGDTLNVSYSLSI